MHRAPLSRRPMPNRPNQKNQLRLHRTKNFLSLRRPKI